ncbi:MAG: UpxY family transcription antiterminator [Candidatus Omnitrophota bacterium]|nr:UpxY family transcription antiterminator [Candidatus Omnitrophota bacterium]
MDTFDKVKWYVLYTKPRHEKFVESEFLKRGVDAFTPKITLRRRWSDRIKEVEEPLFKGYCFAKFPLKDKRNIVSLPGVVDIVNFSKKYVPVEDSVIRSLKIMIDNDLKMDPCPYIAKGDFVSIRKGPFKGLEGYVIEKRNKNTTLVVSIDAIAAAVKCVIDMDFVDLVY